MQKIDTQGGFISNHFLTFAGKTSMIIRKAKTEEIARSCVGSAWKHCA